jgi:hypothetical protein
LSNDGQLRRIVGELVAIASLLLTIVGPVPLGTAQKLVIGSCLMVILAALYWWPRADSIWRRPVWRIPWLDPDPRGARRRYRNFRWALHRHRRRLRMSPRQLALNSRLPLSLVCLLLVFPCLIPRDRIREALRLALMLPEGAFEHGCRCDRETAIRRIHWYQFHQIGSVFTRRRPSQLHTKTLRRVLKQLESQLRAELRKRRTKR